MGMVRKILIIIGVVLVVFFLFLAFTRIKC